MVRQVLVDEIIRRFPEHIDTSAAKGVSGVIAWQLAGFGDELDTFALIIEDGIVWTSRRVPRKRDVTVRLGVISFLKLATGHGDPSAMALAGDLELEGDAELALKLLHFVQIPTEGGPVKLPAASTIDMPELVGLIRRLPERQLRERLRGPVGKVLLDEVFRRMPDYVDADRAAGICALVVWQFTGPDGAVTHEYRTLFHQGRCELGAGAGAERRAVIRTDPVVFFKLVGGTAKPISSWLTGKISVRGDRLFAARLPRLFRTGR
jgi:putative sterol carrier protein